MAGRRATPPGGYCFLLSSSSWQVSGAGVGQGPGAKPRAADVSGAGGLGQMWDLFLVGD